MDPLLIRVLLVAAVLLLALAVGRWWQRRDGEVRAESDDRLQPEHLDALGLDLGEAEAGAVLLGSPTCSPCDSVKQVLDELSAERTGFRWVYADAADHLALATRHRVRRVPTVFLLAPGGQVIARTSGVPRPDDLRRVLDAPAA